MKKATVKSEYPPEKGSYLRGNDNSPVAVAVILKWDREKAPPEIEVLVRTGLESGAALSGTLQTTNVGLEKVICNIIANPNIRYLVTCGPESPGHHTGDAIAALYKNGVDENKKIIGTYAPMPYLSNIPVEWIEHFREQTQLIDLVNEGSPEVIRQAVWACYQEAPTAFKDYQLWDPGAFEKGPVIGTVTWKITTPYQPPTNEGEKKAVEKMQKMMEMLKKRVRNNVGE